MAISKQDKEALRYAGIMGHRYVVLTTGSSGERRSSYELDDRDRAIDAAKMDYANHAPCVYEQTAKSKWKAVYP